MFVLYPFLSLEGVSCKMEVVCVKIAEQRKRACQEIPIVKGPCKQRIYDKNVWKTNTKRSLCVCQFKGLSQISFKRNHATISDSLITCVTITAPCCFSARSAVSSVSQNIIVNYIALNLPCYYRFSSFVLVWVTKGTTILGHSLFSICKMGMRLSDQLHHGGVTCLQVNVNEIS